MTSFTYLELHKNLIEGSLPPLIGNLSSLTVLYLDSCNFSGEVPSTLAILTNLYNLALHRNNFTTTNVPERAQR